MQGSKKHLVSFLIGVAENIIANITVVAVPIIIGVLFIFYRNNSQTMLLWGMIALVALNSLGTLEILRQQRNSTKWRSKGILLREDENQVFYLVDVYGKARQIPDIETRSYLGGTLSILLDEIPAIPTKEIIKLRGESLPSIKEWEPPLTPEEQEEKELWRKVSRMLNHDTTFEESATPQRIKVTITNSGEEFVHIQKTRFQHHILSETALSSDYRKENLQTVIPFDQSAANLSPGSSLTMGLELRQKWNRHDLDNIKGQLGYLLLDAVYKGKPVKRIFFRL
jgi:hypothetical protein